MVTPIITERDEARAGSREQIPSIRRALVRETVPSERTGSAMGLLGTMSAIGAALGPSLGGILIAGPGWRAIFLIMAPLGVLNFLLARRYLPVPDREGED